MNGGSAQKPAGLRFLALVGVLYLLVAFFSLELAAAVAARAFSLLLDLLPVMGVVIGLLGLFNYLFDTRKFAVYLRKEAGMRAWFYATAGGVLSHGPAYIWYPMLAELREHGTRPGLIVTFLYVRALKLPWLPVMIDYFGWSFTLFFSFYLILFGIIQGVAFERLNKLPCR